MSDLRTLAQAVVTLRGEIDALALEAKGLTGDNHKAATKRWWEMVRRLQKMNDDLRSDGLCVRILAALDAADAQGYARAMVVDVPQPVVKCMGDHTAAWERGESEVSIATKMAAGPDRVMGYPLALLRAMLADIDAQQGGAS